MRSLYNPRNGTFTEILAKKGNFSVMNSKVKGRVHEARFKQGNGRASSTTSTAVFRRTWTSRLRYSAALKAAGAALTIAGIGSSKAAWTSCTMLRTRGMRCPRTKRDRRWRLSGLRCRGQSRGGSGSVKDNGTRRDRDQGQTWGQPLRKAWGIERRNERRTIHRKHRGRNVVETEKQLVRMVGAERARTPDQ